MRVLLTITKDRRNIYCGHAFLMENLVIEHGRSAEAVQLKLKEAITNMYEIRPESLQFVVRGHYSIKAFHIMKRLKRKNNLPQTEVWFNSQYFEVS